MEVKRKSYKIERIPTPKGWAVYQLSLVFPHKTITINLTKDYSDFRGKSLEQILRNYETDYIPSGESVTLGGRFSCE